MNRIRVIILDESALVRQTLKDILDADERIEVVGTASEPSLALARLRDPMAEVITLEIQMPGPDRFTLSFRKVSPPAEATLQSRATGVQPLGRALELGAMEVIHKPAPGISGMLRESATLLCDAVVAAARGQNRRLSLDRDLIQPKFGADVILPAPRPDGAMPVTDKVVAIGASAGGTEALRIFLEALPCDCPGMVIVQHMPEGFTAAFARRLDSLCAVSVQEASSKDPVLPGHVLIAPGNRHLLLRRSGSRYFVEVRGGPLVSRHRPSVDVLFRSVAHCAGINGIGIIMTGMGDDGARGMREMKEAGAFTLAQDEQSCVVFGMPQEAIKAGGVDRVLPLEALAPEVMRLSLLARKKME
ncbi:MAG TPA: chemotaxis response regulator protein-glutamate methylesterase [Deltaproteobacteria bacterium]|nr:chemotaxis response regulator protein-glutamate methylesterase [Deltaproteobacteria bacterium]HQI79916.1 chemotaxis response regulator protein-glutamate methylesterase [Deltaproteobacteria bacterium]